MERLIEYAKKNREMDVLLANKRYDTFYQQSLEFMKKLVKPKQSQVDSIATEVKPVSQQRTAPTPPITSNTGELSYYELLQKRKKETNKY